MGLGPAEPGPRNWVPGETDVDFTRAFLCVLRLCKTQTFFFLDVTWRKIRRFMRLSWSRRISVCVCVCGGRVSVSACVCICASVCLCLCASVCVCACLCACACVCVRVSVCVTQADLFHDFGHTKTRAFPGTIIFQLHSANFKRWAFCNEKLNIWLILLQNEFCYWLLC